MNHMREALRRDNACSRINVLDNKAPTRRCRCLGVLGAAADALDTGTEPYVWPQVPLCGVGGAVLADICGSG